MFAYLRRLGAAVMSRFGAGGPALLGGADPEDPYAGVRQPRRQGPGGRSSAVALAEPEPTERVHAVAARHTRDIPFDRVDGEETRSSLVT